MSETRKIGIACAIGGAIGTTVALMMAAAFWWLGLLAGFCAGYVSYEFRAVLRAIPVVAEETFSFAASFFGDPHPIFYLQLAVGALVFYDVANLPMPDLKPNVAWVRWLLALIIAGFSAMILIPIFAIGYRRQQRKKGRDIDMDSAGALVLGAELGYREAFSLFVVGVAIVVWSIVTFPIKFPIALLGLIHSDKRLLCGVDSAIGTGIAYITLVRPEMTVAEYALVIVMGAMVGAALGIVNYEVVSKRWLHVEERARRS